MEPISSMNFNPVYQSAKAAEPAAAEKEPPKSRKAQEEAGKQPLRPNRDEYIPEKKWPADSGQPSQGPIRKPAEDDAAKNPLADSPKNTDKAQNPEKTAASGKGKTCKVSTDKVDREIEKLKKEKEELEKQLNSETNEKKIAQLEKRLAQVENELRQKDTDAYRRQHMTRSFS